MAVPSFDYEASLAACAQGDHEALQALYRQEAPSMLALCLKMLPQRSDAEESVRDAFVIIWKNAENYDPQMGTARAWIYSIMRYRVLNRLRQSGRRPAASDGEWADSGPAPREPAGGGAAASNPTVQQLARLDDAQRRPVLMAFYHGLNYEQIAARLATPAAHVKAQVRAGLQAILGAGQA